MGGVCIALYGFIAVSGLKMIQNVDLGDNKNLFVVSVILIAGVGGLVLNFGEVTVTEVACALILGILVYLLVNIKKKKKGAEEAKAETAEPAAEIPAEATVSATVAEENASTENVDAATKEETGKGENTDEKL